MDALSKGYTTRALEGIARLLDGAEVARYRPGGVYLPQDRAVTLRRLPQSPDWALALTLYPLSDDPTLSDSVLGLQVRFRAPGPGATHVEDFADATFDVLQNLGPIQLAQGVRLVMAERRSSAPLGQDDSQRWERSDNYELTMHRPTTHRT